MQIARRGAAELGAIHALNSLRMVGRALARGVIPEQASVAEAHRAFDAEGRPRDTRTEGALLEGGRQVARFAFLHSSAEVQEFLRLWEKAPFTPGARRHVMAILLHAAVFVLGFILIVVTLTSAVKTFVLPRSVTDGLTRAVFLAMRRVFGLRLRGASTYGQRDRIMAFYAPVTLLALLPTWLILVWIGYAGMYWAVGVPTWYQAFRDSGSSLLTLGFEPVGGVVQTLLAFSEATVGLILIALLIAYLPTIYSAFQRREAAVNLLEVRGGQAAVGG